MQKWCLKGHSAKIIRIVICLVLIGSLLLAGCSGGGMTTTSSEPGQISPTGTATLPTEPTTAPTNPEPMYQRQELELLENQSKPYGPGVTSDGKRPPHPDVLQKAYGEYGANFIGPDEKTVYMTFDCGYEYSFVNEDGKTIRVTAWILDVLKEKNVKAVFFVTLPYCKSQPDLVQRMIDEGHAVGNHSSTHPSSMAQLSIDQMEEEVMTLHQYVQENFGYEMHLFRPPTGAFSTQSLAVVQNLGYKNVHWSVAYNDWNPDAQPTASQGYETVTGRHHNGAIYLLHAVSVTNATILSDVIDFLQSQGYQLELFQ